MSNLIGLYRSSFVGRTDKKYTINIDKIGYYINKKYTGDTYDVSADTTTISLGDLAESNGKIAVGSHRGVLVRNGNIIITKNNSSSDRYININLYVAEDPSVPLGVRIKQGGRSSVFTVNSELFKSIVGTEYQLLAAYCESGTLAAQNNNTNSWFRFIPARNQRTGRNEESHSCTYILGAKSNYIDDDGQQSRSATVTISGVSGDLTEDKTITYTQDKINNYISLSDVIVDDYKYYQAGDNYIFIDKQAKQITLQWDERDYDIHLEGRDEVVVSVVDMGYDTNWISAAKTQTDLITITITENNTPSVATRQIEERFAVVILHDTDEDIIFDFLVRQDKI